MLLFILACLAPVSSQAAVDDLTWAPSASQAAPMSLTASDGTGLKLVEMHVEAVVEQPLAFTELHLVFENPEDRQIEGRFEITLPEGAAISRFAMKLGDSWQEGEVVELQAARRAYEDFLHRKTDPALLEYDAGNEFRARVFPIEPRSTKELIISWSHDLDEGEAWSLPTGGLPELGKLTAAVSHEGKVHTLETEYAVPEGDLSLRAATTASVALRGETWSVIRVTPDLDVDAQPVKNATILVDTSASRALSFDALLADLAAVVPTFAGKVRVIAFDQDAEEIWTGKASQFGAEALDRLEARGALGASDFAGALAMASDADRVVLFSDGVITVGDAKGTELENQLLESGIQRLDAVIRGGARDEASLRRLTSSLPLDGVVLDADAMGPEEVARRLGLGTVGLLELEVPEASWIWPREIRGLQPGDTVTVYADLPRSTPLSLSVNERAVKGIKARDFDGPLLVRASAQAEIHALQDRERRASSAEEREAIAAEIVEVSTTHRVLSPHTALLVLETEEDYERFDIPRNALTDILVVEEGELTWMKRSKPTFGKQESKEPPKNKNRKAKESSKPKGDMKKKESASNEGMGDDAFMDAAKLDAAPAAPPPPPIVEEVAMEEMEAPAQRTRSYRGAPDEPLENTRPVATNPADAWEGDYRTAMEHLLAGRLDTAETFALDWRARSPGDPLALLALGQVWEAQDKKAAAARAYGALIDLFPSRADLRRLAGERLETLGEPGLDLAIDTYRISVEQRPDHPSGHRNLAWTLVKNGEHEAAIEVLSAAMSQPFGRFEAAHRILKEDAALIAAAWQRVDQDADLSGALATLGVEPAGTPAIRFVLNWETDANDVDFHIYDGKKGHAYYSARTLRSGGELYADITSGYGPECFAIDNPRAFPYRMQAHYYSRGPMGFGMGKLQVIEHDGEGRLHFDERPFVVMTDGAFVELGEVERSAFK